MEKKLWGIYHGYSVDGGYGDAVWGEELTGTVYATDEEIAAFVEKWDRPVVYDHPYDDLVAHNVRAEEIRISENLEDVRPYGANDWFGLRAKEREFEQEFKKKHGEHWWHAEHSDSLLTEYNTGMERIRKEHYEEVGKNDE